ncbi:hypothetical protein [Thermus sp.]|uniref:hypothetical protein n=1 Tax=Thermus sp. TaxID=275 RepID=UPI003D117454
MRKALLALAGLLAGLALADASDTKTFTVTVTGSESVTIDTGTASLTVDYSSSTCSTVDRFCAWYPTIIYETNYATNRKLVASATTSHPILSVVLEKQTAYPDPFVPRGWGSGTTPGSWAFATSSLTLASTDSDVVLAIQNGKYAIAPILKLVFSTNPPAGTYTADVTFTIMAQ